MTFGPMGGSREQLALGGGGGPELSEALPNGQRLLIRRKPGVLVWDKIPAGASVMARLERSASLQQADGSQASPPATGYRFELAARPPVRVFDLDAVFNAAGGGYPHAIFAGTPSGGVGGGRSGGGLRTFHVTPGSPGAFETAIDIPAWAPFAPVQDGALVNMGKRSHLLPMPNLVGGVAVTEQQRSLLRLRWVGTAAAAQRVATGLAAANRLAAARWGDPAVDGIFTHLTPGSISVTLPTGAIVLRDDGFGRLFGENAGESAVGVVDYVSGAYVIISTLAQTGNIVADFEHSQDYTPINAYLEWDALVPQ